MDANAREPGEEKEQVLREDRRLLGDVIGEQVGPETREHRAHQPAAAAEKPGMFRATARHSTLAPEETTTLAHFAVSAAMTLPKSCGVPLIGLPPSSARRASILGSARARFVSALSFSIISAGVPLGMPIPNHAVAS